MSYTMPLPMTAQHLAKSAETALHPNLWVGLVGLWAPFAGVTGSKLIDYSGRYQDMDLQAAEAGDWVEGFPGYAVAFDGVAEYAVNSAIPSYAATNAITLAVWCKGATGGRPMTVGTAGNSGRHYIYIDASAWKCVVNNAAGAVVTGNAPADVWTFLVMTYDRVTVRLYENGRQVSSRAYAVNLDTTAKVSIGSNVNGGNLFTGRISFGGYWDRALDAIEIAAMYAGATPLHRRPDVSNRKL